MLSLDVLTFTTQSLVIYLYHLITDVLPPNTWHATTWNLPLLCYHLLPATCHVNT